MQREIKFRGQRYDNKTWIYGSLLEDDIIVVKGATDVDEDYIGFSDEWSSVLPESVGQYTGLKDKNGKEIYEGDIIDKSYISPLNGEKVIQRYIIKWENGTHRMIFIDNVPKRYYDRLLFMEYNQAEIIGNIYGNPELLQEVSHEWNN